MSQGHATLANQGVGHPQDGARIFHSLWRAEGAERFRLLFYLSVKTDEAAEVIN